MIEINNLADRDLPNIPWEKMSDEVLGKSYSLSFVLCKDELSHKINLEYRKKDKPTNILSFPLDEESGEIFLNIECAEHEAVEQEKSLENYLAYLFIHGLYHLKGFDHSDEMEELETKTRQKFDIKD